MAEFTDDQIGKRVVAQNGNAIGEVTAVDDGSLRVTLSEDADREVVDHLGWEGVVNREVHTLNDRYISTVREDAVRLRV